MKILAKIREKVYRKNRMAKKEIEMLKAWNDICVKLDKLDKDLMSMNQELDRLKKNGAG